jgi:capsular polysaccharide transport system permease protein
MSEVTADIAPIDILPEQTARGFLDASPSIRIPGLLRRPLFLLLFVIPNVISVLYFGLIASPIYISTSVLTVFNPSQSSSSIVSLLSGGSSDGSAEEAYVLQNYIASWSEFQKVSQPLDLAGQYGRSDFISRYGGLSTMFQSNDVTLWHYYQDHVKVSIDVKSGIALLDVEGYTPEFAAKLANALLKDTVLHMDEMNGQQELDFIGDAQSRKDELSANVQADEAALDSYRSQIGVYDPNALYTSDLGLLDSIALKEADLETQYTVMAKAAPNNPSAQDLVVAINMFKAKQLEEERNIAAIAAASRIYENLLVTRDNDVSLLQQASVAVQDSQLKATQNRYYLNVISAPSQPQTAELPNRLAWIAGMLLATIIIWGLLR